MEIFVMVVHDVYSLSILKRQLERGRDVLLPYQMSHAYTIIFYNTYIFARNIF